MLQHYRQRGHVLLNATAMVMGEYWLNLALHRPDFVLFNPDNTSTHPSKIMCLLVMRKSFETSFVKIDLGSDLIETRERKHHSLPLSSPSSFSST
ncbi:hypothetical protein L2E82_12838 [Cichorium intybus]|uniref:Uncharacterized protein n=1 Tax=Cichorium intybus TaxID=13427 RepID=A0ACB9GH25_CICIN|nr:hypothetical protein L2E82_12838 [Cichorium intybus]